MRKVVLLGLVVLLMTGTAGASLIGDTVTIDGSEFGGSAVVGSGVELEHSYNLAAVFAGLIHIEIDLGADSILLTATETRGAIAPLGSFLDPVTIEISDLDWGPTPGRLIGLELVQSTFEDPISTSFLDDSMTFTIGGRDNLGWGAYESKTFEYKLLTEHIGGTVPEPATITLVGLGLAGLAIRSRRRRA